MLVIGSGGMLGHMVARYLTEKKYNVLDISAKRKFRPETINMNVLDRERFLDFLDLHSFDVVINCAALLVKASNERKAEAVLLNSYFPHFLEEYYRNSETYIIQISTGGVYSGNSNDFYFENSACDTLSFYGKSKLLGELDNSRNLTIRSDFWGPDMSDFGSGLFNWIMHAKGAVTGFGKYIFNGISSLALAEFIDSAIQNRYCGICNLYSQDHISKADFIRLVCETFEKRTLTVNEESSTVKSFLLRSERNNINFVPRTFAEQMGEIKHWIFSHKSLYEHYFKGDCL